MPPAHSPAACPAPARIGDDLAQVDTPALVVDLGAFDRNLDRLKRLAADAGVDIRAHAKTHKSADVAHAQMSRGGAVGVCCQKVSEAQALVAAGVDDILVANQVVAPHKLERLAKLAAQARIAVCIDHPIGLERLSAAATAHAVRIDALVEIEAGGERCGVAPGEAAAALAVAAANTPGVRLRGLQAYNGSAQHVRAHADRAALIAAAAAAARDTAELIRRRGVDVPTITGGGTGTFDLEAHSGVFTEIQCGSYAFMDADYSRNAGPDGALWRDGGAPFEQSLFVLAEVMSTPAPGRAVCDAGHKAASVDCGPPELRRVVSRDVAAADLPVYDAPSDEHGALRDPAGVLRLGDRVLLAPGHIDPTVNLHDWLVVMRPGANGAGLEGGRVDALWPVTARGRLF